MGTSEAVFLGGYPALHELLVPATTVARAIVLQLHVTSQAWEEGLRGPTLLDMFPAVCRVGRTSWGYLTRIRHVASGTLAATVTKTNVAVDPADITKPVPVPCADSLRALICDDVADAAAAMPELPEAGPRPDDAFVWRTEVRASDCDSYGHINEAVYCLLMEDARLAALKSEALPAMHSACARVVSVEYLGQPKANDALEVAVWVGVETALLCFEFFVCGTVVARCRRQAWSDAPAAPPALSAL
eukprot:NODE_3104_length_829_cov_306.599483.p1 GENE.NODE_3104_length_829_cov_306.599483~~NODE_3104_length_829_cov_306.599483.p1  ORF type:complete len:245 (-),score=49.25 NODE_3104_length_829_cov_306.599483:77-811(-)